MYALELYISRGWIVYGEGDTLAQIVPLAEPLVHEGCIVRFIDMETSRIVEGP